MSQVGDPHDPDHPQSNANEGGSTGDTTAPPITRRQVLIGGAALVASTAVGCTTAKSPQPHHPAVAPAAPATGAAPTAHGAVPVTLNLNGKDHALDVDPRTTLLDALRERLDLTGTKKGCDHGQCGACTVLVEGRRTLSCLTFALMVQGQKITTIEGLARGDELHPMQSAFIKHDAFQCGYCTPGQICSAIGLIGEGHARSDDEIRELMSGNICRCGAYPNIVAAVREVLEQQAS